MTTPNSSSVRRRMRLAWAALRGREARPAYDWRLPPIELETLRSAPCAGCGLVLAVPVLAEAGPGERAHALYKALSSHAAKCARPS